MAVQRHCALSLLSLFCVSIFFQHVTSLSKSDLLFPYGATFADQNLVNETDDFNSKEVELTTPIVFYDQVYNSIHVSFIDNSICPHVIKALPTILVLLAIPNKAISVISIGNCGIVSNSIIRVNFPFMSIYIQ